MSNRRSRPADRRCSRPRPRRRSRPRCNRRRRRPTPPETARNPGYPCPARTRRAERRVRRTPSTNARWISNSYTFWFAASFGSMPNACSVARSVIGVDVIDVSPTEPAARAMVTFALWAVSVAPTVPGRKPSCQAYTVYLPSGSPWMSARTGVVGGRSVPGAIGVEHEHVGALHRRRAAGHRDVQTRIGRYRRHDRPSSSSVLGDRSPALTVNVTVFVPVVVCAWSV